MKTLWFLLFLLLSIKNLVANDYLKNPNKPFGEVISLNGQWQIADGVMDTIPSYFPTFGSFLWN